MAELKEIKVPKYVIADINRVYNRLSGDLDRVSMGASVEWGYLSLDEYQCAFAYLSMMIELIANPDNMSAFKLVHKIQMNMECAVGRLLNLKQKTLDWVEKTHNKEFSEELSKR